MLHDAYAACSTTVVLRSQQEIYPYKFDPIGMPLGIFFLFYYFSYVLTLCMVDTPPVTHLWTQKLANHGMQQLLPIASPMGLQYPNKAHRHHPHIVGDVACAWFGRPMCGG